MSGPAGTPLVTPANAGVQTRAWIPAFAGMTSLARSAAPRLCVSLLLGPSAVSGCYRYVPIDPAAARPEEEVRVQLTDAAAARLARELGTYTGRLEGQLGRGAGDSVSVALRIGREYRGVSLESTRQVLVLGRSEVVDVRRRELSRTRTALAGVGALAAFAVVAGTVSQLGDPNPGGDEPPPPPPPGVRALLRIPFR